MKFNFKPPSKQPVAEPPTQAEPDKPKGGINFAKRLKANQPQETETYATAFDKETLEHKEIRLPNEKEQPRMSAAKKPESHPVSTSSDTTSSKQDVKSDAEPIAKPSKLNLLMGKKKANPKPLQKPSATSTGETSKRDLLWGTGLTKKVLSSAANKVEKTQDKSTATVSEVEYDDEVELPTDLMDDAIELDYSQLAAVEGLQKQKYGVLIGSAGKGKTTTTKYLLARILESTGRLRHDDLPTFREGDVRIKTDFPAICFCSFMGKAVQQMKRALPKEYHPLANTIHATLGYSPVYEEWFDAETDEFREVMVFRPSYGKLNKLPFEVVIIDETGTVPISLWHELLDALKPNCRVYMLGDINQLPPVTGHSILGFAGLTWPTYELQVLHRNAGVIAQQAQRILEGKKPLSDPSMEFIVKKIPDGSSEARRQILGAIKHMHLQGQFDPMLDALIVPQNIGNIGQEELNATLVNYFNPPNKDENGVAHNRRHIIQAGYEHVAFAVGDKVMLGKNDTQKRLTNGMVGVVTGLKPNPAFSGEKVAYNAEHDLSKVDLDDLTFEHVEDIDEDDKPGERAASHIMTVKLQNVDEPVDFASAGQYKDIKLAYAITCHKAQGSEYRNVVVVAHASNLKMLTREWLYTAITRAKQRVILLCNHRGLTHAVNNQRIKGKSVEEKMQKFIALSKGGKHEVRLPNPVEITDVKVGG